MMLSHNGTLDKLNNPAFCKIWHIILVPVLPVLPEYTVVGMSGLEFFVITGTLILF